MTPKIILNMRKIGRKVPEGCVYVGRPSPWGNPYRVQDVIACPPDKVGKDRDSIRQFVIDMFRVYAIRRVKKEPEWLSPLKDATALACWCSPLPCHADVLLELLNDDRVTGEA